MAAYIPGAGGGGFAGATAVLGYDFTRPACHARGLISGAIPVLLFIGNRLGTGER